MLGLCSVPRALSWARRRSYLEALLFERIVKQEVTSQREFKSQEDPKHYSEKRGGRPWSNEWQIISLCHFSEKLARFAGRDSRLMLAISIHTTRSITEYNKKGRKKKKSNAKQIDLLWQSQHVKGGKNKSHLQQNHKFNYLDKRVLKKKTERDFRKKSRKYKPGIDRAERGSWSVPLTGARDRAVWS